MNNQNICTAQSSCRNSRASKIIIWKSSIRSFATSKNILVFVWCAFAGTISHVGILVRPKLSYGNLQYWIFEYPRIFVFFEMCIRRNNFFIPRNNLWKNRNICATQSSCRNSHTSKIIIWKSSMRSFGTSKNILVFVWCAFAGQFLM